MGLAPTKIAICPVVVNLLAFSRTFCWKCQPRIAFVWFVVEKILTDHKLRKETMRVAIYSSPFFLRMMSGYASVESRSRNAADCSSAWGRWYLIEFACRWVALVLLFPILNGGSR